MRLALDLKVINTRQGKSTSLNICCPVCKRWGSNSGIGCGEKCQSFFLHLSEYDKYFLPLQPNTRFITLEGVRIRERYDNLFQNVCKEKEGLGI